MAGKRKLWGNLKLLNPKNLAKKVDEYGYHFSWRTHVLLIVGTLFGIGVVGIVFKLQPLYFSIVVGAVLCALPVLVLDMYRKMYEQKRFADVAVYMEQMLYSFQKTGKVISSLKESRELFTDGQMRRAIDGAVARMETGNVETADGIIRESLRGIEEQYGCMKLHIVHELLASTEEYGGETDGSILILLEDMENWKKRGYQLQAEKKKSHTDNVISIVVATILCAAALYILDKMKLMLASENPIEIFQIPLVQVSSVLFLLFQLHVFVKSARELTNDWLTDEQEYATDYIEKSYAKVMQCDSGAKKMFAKERMGYRIAKKDVTNALYQVIPQWLTEMTLLLQNNNVQVSLVKSAETSKGILKEELNRLLEKIREAPESLCSYTSFCENFDLPEVASCMKMLHAVSENGTGNVSVQMNHLLERVHQMQNQADDIRNEATAFRMKLIFAYPVIAATAKLLLDMTIGMFVMFQLLVGIGGM